jgi:outer membrane receptor protein involved in Fe transport
MNSRCLAQATPLPEIGSVTVATKTNSALAKLPVQAERITRTELTAQPGKTVESSLTLIPGYVGAGTSEWYLGQHSNYSELRGLGPGSVLVTFDGVPMNDPLGSWVSWIRIPKLLVTSVEAAHGGASALYGSQALGGAIAIEGSHPTRDAVTYDVYRGNLGTTGTAIGVSRRLANDWGAQAYVDRTDAKGYIRGAVPLSVSPQNPYASYAGQRFRVQLAHTSDHAGQFEFGAFGADEHRSGDFSGSTYYYGKTGFGRYTHHSEKNDVEAVTYVSNDSYTFNRYFGTATSYFPTGYGKMSLDTAGLLASDSRRIGNLTLTGGIDGRNIAGNRNEPRFTSASTFVSGNQQFTGLFTQAQLNVKRSELLFGTRYDTYSQRQASETTYGATVTTPSTVAYASTARHHVSPRVAYRYNLGRRLTLRASYGNAFKAPDWGSLYSTYPLGGNAVHVGNPNLSAYSVDQVDAGLEWNPTPQTRAYATVYSASEHGRIVETLLSQTPTATTYSNVNVGEAASRGYEIGAEHRAGNHVALRLAYANSPTRITSDATPNTVGNLIPQVPVSSTTLSARWFDTKTSAEVSARALGHAYADEQNLQAIDGVFLINASASHEVGSIGSLYLETENLFNQQWHQEPTTYAPPRSILVGLRKSW